MFGLTIRSKCKGGTTPLYTRLWVNNKGIWVNLQLQVDIEMWNKISSSERKQINYLDRLGHSKKLNEIEYEIKDLRKRHQLSPDSIDEVIKKVVFAEVIEQTIKHEQLKKEYSERKDKDVKSFVKKYVKGIETGEILNSKGKKYSRNSINSWKQFKRIFLECFKNQSFTWDEITQSTIHTFINYLDRKGYMGETKNRHIGVFSTLITVAEKQKLHTNGIARKWLNTPTINDNERRALIYLTKDELKSLYEMPLNGLKEKVRDLFLIACYTALRYSDLNQIEKGCIGKTKGGTQVIRIVQQKTRGLVVIPILNEELITLLAKYDYKVPEISEPVLNRYIKQICEELSVKVPSLSIKVRTLLTKTEREGQKAGRMKFEFDNEGYPIKPRWELVCCHTARRTAITNMRLSGKLTTPQIMSISGHKKEETFLKYIRLSLDERADDVASAATDGLF